MKEKETIEICKVWLQVCGVYFEERAYASVHSDALEVNHSFCQSLAQTHAKLHMHTHIYTHTNIHHAKI